MCLSLWDGGREVLIGLNQSELIHGAEGRVNSMYTILWKNQGLIKKEVGRRNKFGEIINVCCIYLGTLFTSGSSFQLGLYLELYHQPDGLRGNAAIINHLSNVQLSSVAASLPPTHSHSWCL